MSSLGETFSRVTCALLLLFSLILQFSGAVKIEIATQEIECISERIQAEETQFSRQPVLSVDFGVQVIAPNGKPNRYHRRNFDVTVTTPSGKTIVDERSIWSELEMSAKASEFGVYKLCFKSNSRDRFLTKVNVIFFTITRDDAAVNDGLEYESGPKTQADEVASHVHLTQVHNLMLRVSSQLQRVKGEQRYFRARLERHLRTNKEVHFRAFLYFMVEATVLTALAAIQIFTVHVMFRSRSSSKAIFGV